MAEQKKMVTMAEFAKKLAKDWKSESIIRTADIIPGYTRIHTRAIAHDWALYGGEPLGRITQDSGMFHSGKTVSSGLEVAALQDEYPDDAILYVDAEHALDIPFYCLMNGIDPDRLWVFEPEIGMSAEQILGTVMEMVDSVSNLRYIVIDSVAALVSESDMSSEFEKDNGMRASIAKSLHKFCREIISPLRLRNIGLKFINQSRITGYMRGSGGSQIPIYGEYGGTAIGFFSSVSKRFGTRKFIDAEGNELSGTKGDGAAGFRIYFNVIKNKTAPTARGGGFITYYYETGLDVVGDTFSTALAFGFIPAASSTTYFLADPLTGEVYQENGKEIKGYAKALKAYLKDHPDFCEKYIKSLQQAMSAKNTINVSLLSDEVKEEINREENSIAADKEAANIELQGLTDSDKQLVEEA